MPNVQQVISEIAKLAPVSLAYDWDNVGLQVGDTRQQVKRILLTLDINEEVLKEAVHKDCNLIISHHPLIFRGLKSINEQTNTGRIIMAAISNNIAIYSAHTNLDIARGGLNDYLAELLGLKNIVPLETTDIKKYYKLVVYIPEDHCEEVKNAMFNKGAGKVGNYSHSSFSTEGTTTFKPLSRSNPYRGKKEEINSVPEIMFTTIVAEDKIDGVLSALHDVHPYEEIAYDLYPLKNRQVKNGIGRVGDLETKMGTEEFIDIIKNILDLKTVKFTGSQAKDIKRVALCTGAGSDYIKRAKYAGADLYLTGEVKYHQTQQAEDIGLSVIKAGHYNTEFIVKDLLEDYFIDIFENVDIIKSVINTNPWQEI